MISQPHTPDIDDIIIAYHTYVTEDGTYSQEFEVSRDEVVRALAAAERRGAEETLAYLIEDYPAYASHEEIRAWIQARLDHVRNADQIGGKICGLDGCESDEIAGHMQDGTLICYDCAREGEMEGGE